MKLLLSVFALSLSLNVFALNVEPIRNGQSSKEILKVLKDTLQVQEDRRGHSPEGGCWDIKVHSLLGMECESASCTSPKTYDREEVVGCFFDRVQSVEDFEKIKNILKSAGLNPRNVIFRR